VILSFFLCVCLDGAGGGRCSSEVLRSTGPGGVATPRKKKKKKKKTNARPPTTCTPRTTLLPPLSHDLSTRLGPRDGPGRRRGRRRRGHGRRAAARAVAVGNAAAASRRRCADHHRRLQQLWTAAADQGRAAAIGGRDHLCECDATACRCVFFALRALYSPLACCAARPSPLPKLTHTRPRTPTHTTGGGLITVAWTGVVDPSRKDEVREW
jgi:hypothetical protein